MGGIGTFFLLIIAVLAIVVFVKDPFGRLALWMRGKTQSELTETIEAMDGQQFLKAGCWGAGSLVFSLFLAFFFEPIYILTAITGEIGRKEVAYVALIIVIAYWVNFFRGLSKGIAKAEEQKQIAVITESGETVSGNIVEDPNKVMYEDNPYGIKRWIFRLFWGIPEFYMVYLLLVSMRLIAG